MSANTSFSGLQALVAMTVLSRVLPCYNASGGKSFFVLIALELTKKANH